MKPNQTKHMQTYTKSKIKQNNETKKQFRPQNKQTRSSFCIGQLLLETGPALEYGR